MVDDYMLRKVLNKFKEIIGIKKFGNTKIWVDADDNLPDDITLRSFVIFMTCVIKDDGKFCFQLFLVF